jgi:hypothetical protein
MQLGISFCTLTKLQLTKFPELDNPFMLQTYKQELEKPYSWRVVKYTRNETDHHDKSRWVSTEVISWYLTQVTHVDMLMIIKALRNICKYLAIWQGTRSWWINSDRHEKSRSVSPEVISWYLTHVTHVDIKALSYLAIQSHLHSTNLCMQVITPWLLDRRQYITYSSNANWHFGGEHETSIASFAGYCTIKNTEHRSLPNLRSFMAD